MGGRFSRVETRRRARGFLLGLLADLPRKNCWTIAEHAGDRDPHGMQHLLNRARWDTDGVRDDLRDYVTTHLGDPDAVLVVDETGDLKKGVCTVGVQRQYTGTAGRIENAQVAVYLTYAGARGHAMIDRELYLPTSWTSDDQRCATAGVPGDVEFLTKPALAAGMIARALDAGVAARWVAGDEVYGADPGLRAELELRRVGYVLAIGCDRRVPTAAGLLRADELTAGLPRRAWQRLSAGAGATGQRYYDWALITLLPPAGTPPADLDTACWWLLVRRHRDKASWRSTAATHPRWYRYASWSASPDAAGPIEESFQAGKGLAGLDEHQVRHWTSWRRWTLLAMVAHALLAVIAAREHTERPAPDGLIVPSTVCHQRPARPLSPSQLARPTRP
jgi:SRSO17 transposase